MLKSFKPVASPDARILILGSMPGERSLQMRQYYAWPHNAFWPIMSQLLQFAPTEPYPKRCQHITAAKIALWDVLASCHRTGSLDSNIKNEKVNDFARFFNLHPQIKAVFFNGQKAHKLFTRYALKTLPRQTQILHLQTLPSTSPAHAAIDFQQKLNAWRTGLNSQK
ncbi:MAG: DNA-deoxyinosine glycosylase [Phycisphaerae bacterium]|nr:DNA-deoxyinosine glycosylase [Phycisphaerae bacterium]